MSLLLSLLGTTALLGATAVTPTIATLPKTGQQADTQETGRYTINKTIEAEAKALGGSSEVQKVTTNHIEIPWYYLGVNTFDDYMNIDWENSWFVITAEIYYWDNIWGNAGTLLKKNEIFNEVDPLFDFHINYEDGRGNSGFGRAIDHTWEYNFSDDMENLTIDTKVWALARDKLAISYASITFKNLAYGIYFNE